jgi:hypothetical protein
VSTRVYAARPNVVTRRPPNNDELSSFTEWLDGKNVDWMEKVSDEQYRA